MTSGGRSHPPSSSLHLILYIKTQQSNSNHFSGSIEFRRGGTRPFVKSDGGGGGAVAGERQSAVPGAQQVYVPPAQRKDPPPLHSQQRK
ncbi:hypothetical protein LSTR_LSTR013642 [Laodelphax striatellus]|uniref:Uncharacterized protein n=1 Tax=Laodelphax striatellus TaxID=195883 RepID=A0A482X8R1_LAOST|nr:hypothetical protein LSTR_LSTR013642 [Laodelphax striatellus]